MPSGLGSSPGRQRRADDPQKPHPGLGQDGLQAFHLGLTQFTPAQIQRDPASGEKPVLLGQPTPQSLQGNRKINVLADADQDSVAGSPQLDGINGSLHTRPREEKPPALLEEEMEERRDRRKDDWVDRRLAEATGPAPGAIPLT